MQKLNNNYGLYEVIPGIYQARGFDAQIADGTAKIQGDATILAKLASTMVDFDARFEIMPGTKSIGAAAATVAAYQAVPRQPIAE